MKHWRAILALSLMIIGATLIFVPTALFSNYHVEQLEYADVDFEWVDDFQNYEVVIVHNEQPHYLTVKENKIKFIYTTEDFLNFVVVDHKKRVVDGKDNYSVKHFYINLNYKENKD